MYFKRINLNKHKEMAVSFREDEYLRWLSSQI